jgi:hypothetical protein
VGHTAVAGSLTLWFPDHLITTPVLSALYSILPKVTQALRRLVMRNPGGYYY